MHLFEEINVLNTRFITGGALSGKWWGSDDHGTDEGFVLVKWDGHAFHWEYVDFGWDASAYYANRSITAIILFANTVS